MPDTLSPTPAKHWGCSLIHSRCVCDVYTCLPPPVTRAQTRPRMAPTSPLRGPHWSQAPRVRHGQMCRYKPLAARHCQTATSPLAKARTGRREGQDERSRKGVLTHAGSKQVSAGKGHRTPKRQTVSLRCHLANNVCSTNPNRHLDAKHTTTTR